MKDSEVIQYFEACKSECEEETKQIRSTWDTLLNQYMCIKDFSKKKNWQFKVYTPISKPTIKKATRIIKNIMLQAGQYFDFQSPITSPEKQKKCDLTKRSLKVHLNAAKFIDQFAVALESGFTLGLMILKFFVSDEKDHFVVENDELVWNSKLKLKIKPVNPFNFYFTRDGSINIEEEWIKLPLLKEMIDNDDSENPVYNKKVFKRIMKGDYGVDTNLKDEDKERLMRLGIMESGNKFRKDVLVSHFWGPLIDKDNNVQMENCNFIVINEKYILLKPRENPYWHKKSPYVYDSPLKVLFRHIGKGLTEDISGIEDAIVDFVNLQLDNLMWQMLGINEVDEMALTETGKAALRELYPGKQVTKRTGYQGNAFEYHAMGTNPDKAMGMLNELKFFAENDHGVTEYVKAMSGGSETATEYSGKRQSALSDFQSIAQDIESGFMVEGLDRARDLMVQYLIDVDDDRITAIFAENELQLAGMTEAQKREMIVTDVDFIARGISVFFERENLLNKLGSYVKFLNAMPDQAKAYPRWAEVLKRINDAYAFDKQEDLLYTEEEVQKLRAQAEKKAMEQMQMQLKIASMQRAEEHKNTMDEVNAKIKGDITKALITSDDKGKDRDADMKMKILDTILDEGATGGSTVQG